MVCVTDCSYCVHRRDEKKNGWISTCDAFPDGKPLNFDYSKISEGRECNNGIGFEPKGNKK